MKRSMVAFAAFALFALPAIAQQASLFGPDPTRLPTICRAWDGTDFLIKFSVVPIEGTENEIKKLGCVTGDDSYQFEGNEKKFKTLRSTNVAVKAVRDFAALGFTPDEVKNFYEFILEQDKAKKVAKK